MNWPPPKSEKTYNQRRRGKRSPIRPLTAETMRKFLGGEPQKVTPPLPTFENASNKSD